MEKDHVIHKRPQNPKGESGNKELESCLEKLPLGGSRSYAEEIRGIRLVYDEINQERPDRDEEIRDSIAKRKKRTVGFIDICLSNSEYLTERCLDKLVDKNEEHDFFVESQKTKRQIQKLFIEQGLSTEDIAERISGAIWSMRTEYRQTGKINKKEYTKMAKSENWDIKSLQKPSIKPRKPLEYWTPPKETAEQRPFQRSEIKQKFEAMLREMSSFGNAPDIEPAVFEQKMRELFHSTARFLCQLSQKVPREGGEIK